MPSLARAAQHVHTVAPYYLADRPASVQANPTILMFSIFGLLGGSVLALETIWRIAGAMKHDPYPKRHPVTAHRRMWLCAMISLLCFIGPDAVVFMAWPDVAPSTRYAFSLINRSLDFAAMFPLCLAWLLGIYAQPTIDYQMRREPLPTHLWPTWRQLRRPLWIGLLLLLVSMGLSIGR